MNPAATAPNESPTGPARASLGWAALRLQPDEELERLVRSGYEQAFDAIVERYRGPLLRYATPLVGPHSAEDVVQQAFEKALDHLRTDPRPLQLRPWLYRVTHNGSLSVLERKGSSYEQLDENHDGVAQPPDIFERNQDVRSVFKQVGDLPERQRSALMLQAMSGLSYEQIADDMHVSPPVVRQLLFRARTSLRNALGAAIPAPVIRAWLAGAAPDHAHIGELVAGAGAGAGMIKAGVAVLATGVIATGAGVGAARHERATGTNDAAAAVNTPAVGSSNSVHDTQPEPRPAEDGGHHSGTGHHGSSHSGDDDRHGDDRGGNSGSSGGGRSGSDDSGGGHRPGSGSGSDDGPDDRHGGSGSGGGSGSEGGSQDSGDSGGSEDSGGSGSSGSGGSSEDSGGSGSSGSGGGSEDSGGHGSDDPKP